MQKLYVQLFKKSFMNALDFIKFSIDEEHKLIDKVLDSIDSTALGISLGDDDTVGKRLKHITGAEFRMASYVYEKENEGEFEVDETSVESLKKAFQRSKDRHLETISNLTLDDFDKIWVSQRSGKEFSYKWLLYHFIEHISTHRGQVSMALRLFGKP